MDVAQPVLAPMGPPALSSPNGDRQTSSQETETPMNGGSGQAVGAAAAAQQPKVVQTAFIHKLYKCVKSPWNLPGLELC